MTIEYRGQADPKLQPIIDIANKAVDTFINAVADMEEYMAFKAFTIGPNMTEEQRNSLLDVLMTQFAIRMKEMAPELMEEKTITCATEETEDGVVVWFKATNDKPEPPAKEVPYGSFDPKEEVAEAKIELLSPEEYEKRKAEITAQIIEAKAAYPNAPPSMLIEEVPTSAIPYDA